MTVMKKLFDMVLIQGNDICMGETYKGEVLIAPTDKGYFNGEELKGVVVPVGMGIVYTKDPGKNDIKTTMLLETDDGAKIIMDMEAWFDIDPDVEKKMSEGISVDPDEYYYKGNVVFQTDSEKYKWLERKVCVCTTEVESWERLHTTIYIV